MSTYYVPTTGSLSILLGKLDPIDLKPALYFHGSASLRYSYIARQRGKAL